MSLNRRVMPFVEMKTVIAQRDWLTTTVAGLTATASSWRYVAFVVRLLLVVLCVVVTQAHANDEFFKRHCVSCHSGAKPEGGFKLEGISSGLANRLDDPATMANWTRIFDRVAKSEMPPHDADQPSELDRTAFVKSLRATLHATSLAKQQRNGRVLVRRLNRNEYQNTVRDLFGVTTDVKSLLPEDSIVAGFDNISSGLQTSATHLVRYQEAADRVLADALPAEIIPTEPFLSRLTGREFLDSRPKPNREGMAPLVRFEGDTIVLCAQFYKHGSVQSSAVPSAGRYRFRASVGAVRNNGKPIPVLVGKLSSDRFAHEKLEHILAIQDAPAEKRRVIEVIVNLPRGEQVYVEGIGLTFFGELKKQLKDQPVDDGYQGPGLAVDWIEIEGPLDVGAAYRSYFGGLPRVPQRFYEDIVAGKDQRDDWSKWNPGEFSKPHNRLRLVSKDAKADAERLIRAFLPRAFRRPVTEEVLNGYLQSAHSKLDQGAPLEDVLVETYKAALCSPHFLMLIEKPGVLDDYAIASRLSYFLWNSGPDEELLAAAAKGELSQPEPLRAQTERLLKHVKSKRFIESFTGQWLELRKIHDMKPDVMYVEYDDMLAWSLPEETRAFFEEVLAQDLPTSSFLHSDWTMLNERLAQHYGIAQETLLGLDLRKVKIPADLHRGGVVTHASVLKLTTNATYTSPVKRGAWILERILGTPPAPPPPNVAAIEPDIRGAVTIREQLAKHKSVPVCASCHQHIDPPGFALESFDVVGGWREFYRSREGGNGNQYVELANYPGRKVWLAKPVEASGDLATGEHFGNVDAWKELALRDRDQLTRNLAEKLLIYATGSTLQFADREAVDEIVAKTREKHHGFRSLIHKVVQSRVFRTK